MSISLDHYLIMNPPTGLSLLQPTSYHVISDASYYGIASAILCPATSEIIAWTAVDLTFDDNERSKFQPQREYLGLLVSTCLIQAYLTRNGLKSVESAITFRWTTDCTGAQAWGESNKCSSSASFFANAAISWLQLFRNIYMAEAKWIPGTQMQDIDRLSRRREQKGPHSSYAPNAPLEKEMHLQLEDLMQLCNPYINRGTISSHHDSFLELHKILSKMFPST